MGTSAPMLTVHYFSCANVLTTMFLLIGFHCGRHWKYRTLILLPEIQRLSLRILLLLLLSQPHSFQLLLFAHICYKPTRCNQSFGSSFSGSLMPCFEPFRHEQRGKQCRHDQFWHMVSLCNTIVLFGGNSRPENNHSILATCRTRTRCAPTSVIGISPKFPGLQARKNGTPGEDCGGSRLKMAEKKGVRIVKAETCKPSAPAHLWES